MASAPLLTVKKADYFVELAEAGRLPGSFAQLYGSSPEQFFLTVSKLAQRYPGKVGDGIPWPAVALYTYLEDRLAVGLQQLMAGARKWRLDLLGREDLAATTEYARKVTGIPTMEELAERTIKDILDF